MKMIPALSKKSPKRIALIAVLGIFLVLMIFNDNVRLVVARPLIFASNHFLKMKSSVSQWWQDKFVLFKSKSALEEENKSLKEKNSELEVNISFLSSFQKENEDLKSLFSQMPEKKKYVLASVISRPPASPYDILIVDAGSKNGVEMGMTVVFENAFLGYVAEVFPQTSKIKLVSFPSEEINVMIEPASGGAGISAVSIGQGGGNMEVKIPSSVEIHSGDKIMTPGTYPLLMGAVENVELNVSDPFQKIHFRLPVNLQELKYVMIEK